MIAVFKREGWGQSLDHHYYSTSFETHIFKHYQFKYSLYQTLLFSVMIRNLSKRYWFSHMCFFFISSKFFWDCKGYIIFTITDHISVPVKGNIENSVSSLIKTTICMVLYSLQISQLNPPNSSGGKLHCSHFIGKCKKLVQGCPGRKGLIKVLSFLHVLFLF